MSNAIHINDYNLVHKCLCGDEDAGESLYGNVYPPLRKYVLSLIAKSSLTPTEADDIVAEALTRTYQKLSTFNGKSSFYTFCCRYANYVFLESLKRANKTNANTLSIDAFTDNDSHVELSYEDTLTLYGQNPPDIIIRAEFHEMVWRAFSNLSESHRQILRLRLLNRTPFKEIASFDKSSVEAVSSRYRRASKALEMELKKIM